MLCVFPSSLGVLPNCSGSTVYRLQNPRAESLSVILLQLQGPCRSSSRHSSTSRRHHRGDPLPSTRACRQLNTSRSRYSRAPRRGDTSSTEGHPSSSLCRSPDLAALREHASAVLRAYCTRSYAIASAAGTTSGLTPCHWGPLQAAMNKVACAYGSSTHMDHNLACCANGKQVASQCCQMVCDHMQVYFTACLRGGRILLYSLPAGLTWVCGSFMSASGFSAAAACKVVVCIASRSSRELQAKILVQAKSPHTSFCSGKYETLLMTGL